MKLKACPNPFSREPVTKNRGKPYNQLKGGRQIRDDPFEKEIILLTDPTEEQVLSGKVYTRATLQGRAILTYWDKMWTGQEIHSHIRSTFKCFLGHGIKYELLVPRCKDLVKLEDILQDELDGKYLYKAYARKSIYIRLTEKLKVNSDVHENDQPDNSSYKIPSYSKNLNNKVLEAPKSYIAPKADVHENDQPDNSSYKIPSYSKNFNNKVPEAPKSYIAPKAPSESVSIGQILKQHSKKYAIDENIEYNIICKKEIWSCVLRTVKRHTFSPLKKPAVMFAEDQRSEGVIAAEGSTPEFFRLVLLYLKDSNMFKGPENAKELNFSNKFLQDGSYYYCGMIIAMSLFHGGPGPSFFSEQFYKCFCEENVNFEKTAAITIVLRQLQDMGQLNHILNSSNSVIQGFMDFNCQTEALQQFIEGFQTLIMYTVVQKNYKLFQEVFCCKNKKLRASDVNNILKCCFSEDHSEETRKMENGTICFFRDLLWECQENVVPITLEDVMILITGLECEPPLGFTQRPCVKFLKDPNQKLPIANTSKMTLFLPTVHEKYENFKTSFRAVWK